MIVTLTPNPSLDRTVAVPAMARGEVNRATSSRIDPGGKGVNISRALTANGFESTAVLPIGGSEGHLMEVLLDRAGIRRATVAVDGALRMNVAVVEPDGTTTKINEPGPALSRAEQVALLDAATMLATGANWVVGCGSLPPGVTTDVYAQLVSRARRSGARVAIDSSGAPMAAAVAAKPTLIKPNHEELEEIVGGSLGTLAQVVDAARSLVAGGIELVVVSLGGDGAVLVDTTRAVHATATVARPRSTVGAGDCLLAGVLAGLTTPGSDRIGALVAGVRWGAAAVALPGSAVPGPADLAQVTVEVTEALDLARSIR